MFILHASHAQDRPIRVGVKIGVPNIIGFNGEYVLPVIGGRLGATADFSRFSIDLSDVEVTFSYIEFGGNVYLKEGKGPYAGLTFGRIGFDGTWTDQVLGEGTADIGLNTLNLKLGGKFGGLFYIRTEFGFALLLGDSTVSVDYATVSQDEDIPGALAGGLIGSFGFGFSF